MARMPHEAERSGRAAAPLEVGAALADPLHVAMSPEQGLARANADGRAARNRKSSGPSLPVVTPARVDAYATPSDILDDLEQIDRLAQMKRLHSAVHLFQPELRRLVNHYPPRRAPCVPPAVKVHRARHHPKHLCSREEGIVSLNFELMGIVGNEFEARPLRVKHLATTSHKPWAIGFGPPHRVRNSDIGRLRISIREFPRNTPRFDIECEADAPHDTCPILIGECFVLAQYLNRQSPSSSRCLQMIVQVEIIRRPSRKSHCPTL